MGPSDAIAAHRAGELDGIGLVRALVSFDHWLLPARVGEAGAAPLVTVRGTERWLTVCSDRAAFDAAGAPGDLFLDTPGPGLFARLDPGLAGVNIDPGTGRAIHYQGEQLDTLREMGRAVLVERFLHGAAYPDGLQKLRDYDGYRIVMRAKEGGGIQMVLAPDNQDRLLAAVFTAPDTLRAFLASLPEGLVPIVVTLDGTELFTRLRELTLHGIVFNCRGPVKPRAVSAQLASEVLRQTQP